MTKYVLAGLCLLAFVAGGIAQLALHRTDGPSGKAETVLKSVEAATPQGPETAAQSPAQTGGAIEAPPPEAHPAETETPADTSNSTDGRAEARAAAPDAAENARRTSPFKGTKAAYRAAPKSRTYPRPAPAPRPASAADANDGPHEKAARGARKTGKWLGKGLKKLGGVFHD